MFIQTVLVLKVKQYVCSSLRPNNTVTICGNCPDVCLFVFYLHLLVPPALNSALRFLIANAKTSVSLKVWRTHFHADFKMNHTVSEFNLFQRDLTSFSLIIQYVHRSAV